MALKVAYSEGHGKHTPGKRTPAGEREWFFNNLMGQGFREELAKYSGVLIKLVSDATGERDVPLQERADISNDWGADVYLAFHHNAFQGKWAGHTGTETYTYNGAWGGKSANNPKELALAKAANDGIVAVYKLRNRGLKKANFFEVRVPKATAALTEGGYMDSTIDIKVMRDSAKVKEAGRQVARNLAALYGLVRKGGMKDTSKEAIYRVQVGSYQVLSKAAAFAVEVEKKTGFGTYLVDAAVDGKRVTRVQVGAFSVKSNADSRLKELKKVYPDAWITTNGAIAIPQAEPQNEPEPAPPKKSWKEVAGDIYYGRGEWKGVNNPERRNKLESLGYNYDQVQGEINRLSAGGKVVAPTPIAAGDKVTLNSSAHRYATGELIPANIKGKSYTVHQAPRNNNGNREVLLREIMSWVNASDVIKSGGASKPQPAPKPAPKVIKAGSKVTLKSSASKYATGENIPSSIKGKSYTVQQTGTRNGKKQVLLKEIYSWVWEPDVQ